MGSSSVVLLTGHGPEHKYVASTFSEALGERLQAIVLPSPQSTSLITRLRRASRRYSTLDLLSRLYWHTWRTMSGERRKNQHTIRRVLFSGDEPEAPPESLLRVVPSHNGEACEALLRKIEPRILAVYGTAIIEPHIIETADKLALNLHTGISPRYRGASSVFWALHNEEPEWVGSTVHILDSGVDSGDILGIARPRISADDDVASLFAKCVKVGAKLYVDRILAALEGPVERKPQDLEKGRQYTFSDRTVAAERRVRRLLRGGLLDEI